jgi:hypothetical protein
MINILKWLGMPSQGGIVQAPELIMPLLGNFAGFFKFPEITMPIAPSSERIR